MPASDRVPEMTDREKYLFDVRGYIVVKGFLTDGEVAALNAAADANADRIQDCDEALLGSATLRGTVRRRQYRDMLTWEPPWCDPFRDLLAHPGLWAYLHDLLGLGWHIDTEPFYFHYPKGASGLNLHQGDPHFHPGAYYSYRNGEMRNGLLVAQFTLSDQRAGDGGFAAIPGSHKSNFRRPWEVTRWEEDRELVDNPTVLAGDLLIFTEALTHGTLPWTAAHDRRALHYRYASKYVQFGSGMHEVALPAWTSELTEAQRAVLEPAYGYHRPLVRSDGSVTRPAVDAEDPPYRYGVPDSMTEADSSLQESTRKGTTVFRAPARQA